MAAQRDREVLYIQRDIFAAEGCFICRGGPTSGSHQSFTVDIPLNASFRAFVSAIIQDW